MAVELDSAGALAIANRCVVTLSMDDQYGVPWCQWPLFAAAGWFGVHRMIGEQLWKHD